MKTHPHLRRIGLFAAFSLLFSPFFQLARSASSSTPSPSAVSSLTVSGTNTFLSGSTVGFAAGSTVSVSGIFGGTPSGGTLNLSNLTLTLGTPTITGALALPTTTTIGASGPNVASALSSRTRGQGITRIGSLSGISLSLPASGLSDFSYFADINASDISSNRCILGDATLAYMPLYLSSGVISYSGGVVVSGTAVTVRRNHFVGVTRTAGVIQIWCDGVPVGAPGSDAAYSAPAIACYGGFGSTYIFHGILGNLYPYNRALPATGSGSVVSLYESGIDGVDCSPSGAANGVFPGVWVKDSGTGTFASTAADNVAVSFSNAGQVSKSLLTVQAGDVVAIRGVFTGISGITNCYLFDAGLASAQVRLSATGAIMTATKAGNVIVVMASNNSAPTAYTGTGVSIDRLGVLAAYSPSQLGIGYQLHDISGHNPPADIILSPSGVTFAQPAASGPAQVRATLTWAGSHEAKSLLGQVALPANSVVTSIITTASAADPGGGMTVGSVTTPNLFVNAVAYTTAKKVHTLAAQLPAGTATNDLNLVVDPGTSNYTGTIQIAVNYVLAQ